MMQDVPVQSDIFPWRFFSYGMLEYDSYDPHVCFLHPRGNGVKPRPPLYNQATSKTGYAKQSRGSYQRKPLLRTERLNRRTVARERLIKSRLIFTKGIDIRLSNV